MLCIYNEDDKLLCSLEYVLLLRTLHRQCKLFIKNTSICLQVFTFD